MFAHKVIKLHIICGFSRTVIRMSVIDMQHSVRVEEGLKSAGKCIRGKSRT
jgi:hypothetical protein